VIFKSKPVIETDFADIRERLRAAAEGRPPNCIILVDDSKAPLFVVRNKDEAKEVLYFVLDVHWTVGDIGEGYRRSAVMTCTEDEARFLCTKRVRATTKRPVVVCFEDKRLVEWLRYSGFKTAMVSRPPRTLKEEELAVKAAR